MTLLQRLRRRPMPAGLVRALLPALPGLLLLVVLAPALAQLFAGPRDLYALSADELEGAYVGAQIDTIWDWYADTVSTASDGSQRIVAREYLVPLADGQTFIGVRVSAARIATGDHVLEQTALWRSDPDGYLWDGIQLPVRGTVRPMDEQTRELYYGYLADVYGLTGEELDRFPPLVLVDGQLNGLDGSAILLLGTAVLILFSLAGVRLARALNGEEPRQSPLCCGACPRPGEPSDGTPPPSGSL